jgi:transcriptional regulator with XRE-family HTH domain
MRAKKPNRVDIEVGRRVRQYRLMANMSQTDLGKRLGVTFQQVQKYEKGANRVGAGRLMRAAEILNVPITAFFDGMQSGTVKDTDENPLADFSGDPQTNRLLEAFSEISDLSVQSAIVNLVEVIRAKNGKANSRTSGRT